MYVPVQRLEKYRSSLTRNGDVIVRDVVPFHEIQDVWLAGKSPELGKPATNHRKISNDKIVNEVGCQCELADRSVPPAIVEGTMNGLVTIAEQKGRTDLVNEMQENWKTYSSNPMDGNAATAMGAALVIARHELRPKECAVNRLCPNCMFKVPKNLMRRPQCHGEFISAGVVNQSAPVEVICTKAELDEMVREREEKLKRMNFFKDDDLGKEQSTKVVNEKPKERNSPEDEDMGVRRPKRENVDDDGTVMIEIDDDSTSFSSNQGSSKFHSRRSSRARLPPNFKGEASKKRLRPISEKKLPK